MLPLQNSFSCLRDFFTDLYSLGFFLISDRRALIISFLETGKISTLSIFFDILLYISLVKYLSKNT